MGGKQTKNPTPTPVIPTPITPSRDFSAEPVYTKTDQKGFRKQIFVMYHATKWGNVKSILDTGFRPSASGMLGPGLYLSRDINKTRNYGDVCFKLLVYTGWSIRLYTTFC